MCNQIFRYEFSKTLAADDIESTIVLVLTAVEALHGESPVQLASPYLLDIAQRKCVVDASTAVGRDFSRLLLGFLRSEFGREAFAVRRVTSATSTITAMAS